MERYTKQGKDFYIQLLFTVCMFLLSLYFLYSLVFNFVNSHSLMEYLLTLMVFCFSLSIWGSYYITIRSLLTKIFVNEKGIGIKRFGKVKLFIEYKDIKDVGIGRAMTPTKTKEKLYFSSRILNQEEKNDLDLMQNKIIYFTNLDSDWEKYIKTHLNISSFHLQITNNSR